MFVVSLSEFRISLDGMFITLVAQEAERLFLQPDSATVAIVDDDRKYLSHINVKLIKYEHYSCDFRLISSKHYSACYYKVEKTLKTKKGVRMALAEKGMKQGIEMRHNVLTITCSMVFTLRYNIKGECGLGLMQS